MNTPKTGTEIFRSLRLAMVFIFFSLNTGLILSTNIDSTTALTVAKNFYFQQCSQAKGLSLQQIQPSIQYKRDYNGHPTYYVVNFPASGGWVLVCGQDFVNPILAYNDTGSFNPNPLQLPPPVALKMDRYHAEIAESIDMQYTASKQILGIWNNLVKGQYAASSSKASAGPLLSTTWGQGCDYNNSCPTMAGGPCGHALVGCVAVAMGQVMKYWNFPARGHGSHSYTHSTLGTISTSFAYSFDYDNMPNSLTTTTTDVDELLFRCGVAVEMDYGTGASNAGAPVTALEDYFYFNTSAALFNRSSYSYTTWTNSLIADLNLSRPVIYGAQNANGGGGHMWVIDGYNDNYLGSGSLYFHCNWGWYGNQDGYYTINDLTPGGSDYSIDEVAILNLVPLQCNLTNYSPINSISYSNDVISMGCRVWNNASGGIARATQLGYYLSTNTNITIFDYLLAVDDVPILSPNYASNESMATNVHNAIDPIPPGVYYAGYIVDHLYEEDNESSESDNDYLFGGTYTVNCASPGAVSATNGTYDSHVAVSWNSVFGASYYKVYRNTSNTTSGATILSSWQSSTSYNDYTAAPGVNYYYFVKAATTTGGAYSSNYSYGNLGYISIHVLNNDLYQIASSDPSYYSLQNSYGYWYAVGVRAANLSDNWSMRMYSDATFTTEIASSTYTYDVDFIVIDGNHTPVTNKYVKPYRVSGTGNAVIEYEGGNETIALDATPDSNNWPINDVVQMWDVYLNPGTYYFSLNNYSGNGDLDFGLYQSSSSAYHGNRQDRVAGSTSAVAGGDESFIYTITSSDWYGLCVWNNNGSSCNFALSVTNDNYWTGTVSHDWHNASNWSGGIVPDNTIDAIIPAGYTYYPKLLSSNGVCKTLTVESGAQIELNSYDLSVVNDVFIHGTLDISQFNGDLLVNDDIHWYSGSSSTMVNGAEIRVKDDWTFSNGANVQLNGGRVVFEGTDPSTIYNGDEDCHFYDVWAYKSGASLTLAGPDTMKIQQSLALYNGCSLVTGSNFISLETYRIFNPQSGGASITFDYGQIKMTGGNSTSTLSPGDYLNDLVIGEPAAKSTYNKTFNTSILIKGDLTINSGTFSAGDSTIFIEGNWANYAGSSGFNEAQGTVEFIGSNAADILTDETFYDFVLDKSYSSFDGVEISDSVTILNNFVTTDGTFEMNNPSALNVRANLTIYSNAGINANDGAGIRIYVGKYFYDYNAISTTYVGYESGTSTLIMNGSTPQYIRLLYPIYDVEINSTGGTVYPFVGVPLVCNDLNILQGVFVNNATLVDIGHDLNIYGTLRMSHTNDTIHVARHVNWYNGSNADINTGSISVGGNWEFYSGANANLAIGNTVYLTGQYVSINPHITSQTNGTASFGNLVIESVGSSALYGYYFANFSAADSIRISGDLIMKENSVLRVYNEQLHIQGTIDMDPTSQISHFINQVAMITVEGDFSQTGLIELDTGSVIVHGEYELANSGELRMTGGDFIADAPSGTATWFYFRGKMVMEDGLFEITENNLFVSSAFTDSISGGTIRLGKTIRAAYSNTFQLGGGTLEIIDPSATNSYYIMIPPPNFVHDLVLNVGGGRLIEGDGTLDIQGDLRIESGQLNAYNDTIMIQGDWTNSVGDLGFAENNSQVIFYGNGPSDLLTPETFNDLTLDKTYSGYMGLEIMIGDSITVLNDLKILDGTLEMNDSSKLQVYNDIFIENGAGLNANDLNTHLYLEGNWTNNNTLYSSYVGFSPGLSSTVTWTYYANQLLTSAATHETFCNLSIIDSNFSYLSVPTIDANHGLDIHGNYYTYRGKVIAQQDIMLGGDIYTGSLSSLISMGNIHIIGISNQTYQANSYPTMRCDTFFIDKILNKGYSPVNAFPPDPGSSLLSYPKAFGDTLFIEGVPAFWPDSAVFFNDGTVYVDSNKLSTSRHCEINDGARIHFSPGSKLWHQNGSIHINNGGVLNTEGSSLDRALVQLGNDGDIIVENGGTISSVYTDFTARCNDGVLINPGGIVDPVDPFFNCSFSPDNPNPTFPCDTIDVLITFNNDQNLIIDQASFLTNPAFTASTHNVSKPLNSGSVTFTNYTGDLAGEANDDDIHNRIHWVDTLNILCEAIEDSICFGDSTSISLTINGGKAPFWIQWSPQASMSNLGSNPSVHPTTSTTYQCIVIDDLGNRDTCWSYIHVNSPPIVNLDALSDSLCDGDMTMLTASGANSYVWSHGLGSGATKFVTPGTTTTYTVTGTDINGCTATDEVTIVVHPNPTAVLNAAVNPICMNDTAFLTASGGVSYAWSHGLGSGNTRELVLFTSTTVSVTVSDANGCQDITSLLVDVNPLPSVTTSVSPATICNGETSSLSVSGASTYEWSHGLGSGSSKTVNPLATTTYTVTGTDANGCENTAAVTVTVNSLPSVVASASPSIICDGETSSLSASGAATYEWSHGLGSGSSKTVNPLATTTYTVTGTDINGCVNTASVTVTVNSLPTVSASASPSVICDGETSSLSASGAATYEWSHGLGSGSSKSVNPSVTTTYTVTGTEVNGCENTATVTVTVNSLPSVAASASPSVICDGESSSLTASGASTYEWSHGLGSGSSKSVNPSATTTYTVTGTDVNGCENTATVTVTVNSLPNVTAIASPSVICDGETSSLSASGAATYEWSHGLGSGSSKTVNPSLTTTYTVTGTDVNGCENTATVTVIVNSLPSVSATASPSVICDGESSSLSASGASTYEWSHGLGSGNSKSVNPSVTTAYTVTGTEVNGCENTATITVTVNSLPTVTASASPTVICDGETSSLSVSGASTYEWSHGLGTGSNKIVNPSSTTTYTVTGTGVSGCENTASVTVTVNDLPIANIGPDQLITYGSATTLTSSPTGGSGSYNYTWSPAASLIDATVQNPTTVNLYAATVFNLTVTDAITSCIGVPESVTVNVASSTLNAIASASPTEICLGDTVLLDVLATGGSGSYTYAWTSSPAGFASSSASTEDSPAIDTWYYITVDDGVKSTVVDSVFVTVNNLPTITASASPGTICNGESSVVSASGGVSYTWNQGLGTGSAHTVSPATSTSYIVTGTNANGCSNTATVSVTVNPLPVVSVSASPAIICDGETSTLTASGASTYAWSNGLGSGSSVSVSPATTTTYTVTGTDVNGCQNTATVTVNVNSLPVVMASASPSTICDGESSSLSASGASAYAWSNGLGSGSSVSVSPATTTTFSVTGTDANGCQNTDVATVSVSSLPVVTASASPSTICDGESSSLSASGASTYAWSNGMGSGSSVSVSPATTTTYTVTGTDVNGCQNTATVTVNVNSLPVVTAFASPSTICDGASSSLTASGVSTYAWSNGLGSGSSVSVSPATTTTYTVTGTDVNGCQNTAGVTVTVHALPLVTLTANPDSIFIGDSTQLLASGAINYTWDQGLSAASSHWVSPVTSTTYTITGTDINGCQSSASTMVYVYDHALFGNIYYLNSIHSPLGNAQVGCAPLAGSVSDWHTANASGDYVIGEMAAGTYVPGVVPAHSWGGGNATDALMIMLHTVELDTLFDMALKAGDVNASGSVNATDAYQVAARFADNISSFTAGDWLYETDTITYTASTYHNLDIGILCYGDVLQDYIPSSKSLPAIKIRSQGTILAEGAFGLPLYMLERYNYGSASLIIKYNAEQYELAEVRSIEENGTIQWSAKDGSLRIAWFNEDGIDLGDMKPAFMLYFKTLDSDPIGSSPRIIHTATGLVSLADGKIMDDVSLGIPDIIRIDENGEIPISVYPNPFGDEITLRFISPGECSLDLEIKDMTGRTINSYVIDDVVRGEFEHSIDTEHLANGVYLIQSRIMRDGEVSLQNMKVIKE